MIKNVKWTDADLQNCIYFQTVVEVSVAGEVCEKGIIQDYSGDTVTIDGGYYLRMNSTFVV